MDGEKYVGSHRKVELKMDDKDKDETFEWNVIPR